MVSKDESQTSRARERAVGQLRTEHRALARVLETLETLTAEMLEAKTAPDFSLLAAMLYYIDIVPEQLHHPKEDDYLFSAVRARDEQSGPLIDRLQNEHRRSPQLMSALERALIHWQGGTPQGLEHFALQVGNYCEFQWAHMRLEEQDLLPRAERMLDAQDWERIEEAFAANHDPLFGLQSQRQFERLYQRIANLAPRKLKLALLNLPHD